MPFKCCAQAPQTSAGLGPQNGRSAVGDTYSSSLAESRSAVIAPSGNTAGSLLCSTRTTRMAFAGGAQNEGCPATADDLVPLEGVARRGVGVAVGVCPPYGRAASQSVIESWKPWPVPVTGERSDLYRPRRRRRRSGVW